MKRTIPLLLCGITGFVLLFSYFSPQAENWGETASIWFNVLATGAFLLGGGNLLFMNLKKISSRSSGWIYAVVTLAAFFITLFIGITKFGVLPNQNYPTYPWSGSYRSYGSPFWWIYEYIFKPLTATTFAMLAFYVASAAFRAFRAKNLEAGLLLGTAFIILLGRTAAGTYLTGGLEGTILEQLQIDKLTVTIMKVFNTAGNRAIMLGIALGLVSTSLKVMLGIDRSYLGSGGG